MIGTIAQVIRGEGLASAMRRASERAGEIVERQSMRILGSSARSGQSAILNIAAAGIAPRLGGVQVQLMNRLREEAGLRSVALLHPDGLRFSAPFGHERVAGTFRRNDERMFEAAVRRAAELAGARTLHIEGMDGVPIESVSRLMDEGLRVILSLHDFSMICPVAALSEETDLHAWLARPEQREIRLASASLLREAIGVIFPSRFLLEQYRALFPEAGFRGVVVEPGLPMTILRSRDPDRHVIAFAGSVKRHKGAHLLPDLMRMAGGSCQWHVFGGGDETLLHAIRQVANAKVHGYYRAGTLPGLLRGHRVGLVVLPSIVPESYSLTLSEAWMAGVPVVAFDAGAIGERIREQGGGWLTPLARGTAGLADVVAAVPAKRSVPRWSRLPIEAAHAHIDLYRDWGVL